MKTIKEWLQIASENKWFLLFMFILAVLLGIALALLRIVLAHKGGILWTTQF